MPTGKTPRFPVTSHMKTKPKNHDRSVVSSKLNFFDKNKTPIARHNDHKPQIAPFIVAFGKISPILS